MWTVLYRTRSSKTQFGVSINVWRLAGNTLNITCNFLYCNHQVHRDLLIALYFIYTRVAFLQRLLDSLFDLTCFFCHRWKNNSHGRSSHLSSSNKTCSCCSCSKNNSSCSNNNSSCSRNNSSCSSRKRICGGKYSSCCRPGNVQCKVPNWTSRNCTCLWRPWLQVMILFP